MVKEICVEFTVDLIYLSTDYFDNYFMELLLTNFNNF